MGSLTQKQFVVSLYEEEDCKIVHIENKKEECKCAKRGGEETKSLWKVQIFKVMFPQDV